MKKYIVKVHENGLVVWKNEDGLIHCEHGPAITHPDGKAEYRLDNCPLTKEQWEQELEKRKFKELTVADIEKLLGYKVKIIK